MIIMGDTLIKMLKDLACDRAYYDDEEFNAMDASGANFDDAYDYGCSDGEISLARTILSKMNVPFEIDEE